MKKYDFLSAGREVVEIELEAISGLLNKLDENFSKACEILLNCDGRIIVTGMGKSGHIGNKIAATLASTGSPAFFVHPGEAGHGDLGMITKNDIVIAISYSGETTEIITILPTLKRLNVPLISLTGYLNSQLARNSTVTLDISIIREACPYDLVPTASTTVALVIGDALSIALLQARGFTKEDFAFSHPGGTLGRRLLLTINDVMRVGEYIPRIKQEETIRSALVEMSKKGLGLVIIVDEKDKVLGVFTDGDLRRTLDLDVDIRNTATKEVMTSKCTILKPTMLAAEALHIAEKLRVNSFPVVDENNQLIGAFNLHDLFKAGII
jgi:arabinose-5-phosphate isomerase